MQSSTTRIHRIVTQAERFGLLTIRAVVVRIERRTRGHDRTWRLQ